MSLNNPVFFLTASLSLLLGQLTKNSVVLTFLSTIFISALFTAFLNELF